MNLLEHRRARKGLFALLYFSEGAPIGFVWWALPTMLRESDVPIERITALTAALTLVWAFKFAWAPLVDVLRGPRWTLRAWIVASQIAMAATLLPLLWLDFATSTGALTVFLGLHAFAAATQDVSIDALAIRSTTPEERGGINGWMQAGMLLGRSAFGGGALILRSRLGDHAVVLLLVGVLVTVLLASLTFRDTSSRALATSDIRQRMQTFGAHLRAAARRRRTWFGLLFAATGGVAFEAVGAVAGPVLVDHGAPSSSVGWFFAVVSVACMLAGALLGGIASDRLGRRRVVVLSSLWIAVAVLVLGCIAGVHGIGTLPLFFDCLGALYFGIGVFTASSYALFMDLTDPALGSTQFSAFMGATNLCESWAVFAVGHLVKSSGYPFAFVLVAIASLAALPFLIGMRTPAADPASRSI